MFFGRISNTLPCMQTSFETQLLYKHPQHVPYFWLTFRPKVSVSRTSFSVSLLSLAAQLGGSVSGGRTLLWAALGGAATGRLLYTTWTAYTGVVTT